MENVNFVKSFEVCADNFDEMVRIATKELGFNTIYRNATQKYVNTKKDHQGIWTDKDDKNFRIEYIDNVLKNTAGAACYIVLDSPVVDSRENPWKTEDVKHEGKRTSNKAFDLIDETTGKVVATLSTTSKKAEDGSIKKVFPTKVSAKKAAQELVKELHTNISIKQYHEDSDPIVARVVYTPSKNTKPGRWLVFGIVND